MNPGFKKEWKLVAKCHVNATSLNIMLFKAIPGPHSAVDAFCSPLPGWRVESQDYEGPVTTLPTNQILGFKVILLTEKCIIQLEGPGSL